MTGRVKAVAAETEDGSLQKQLLFVFTDYLPNANMTGIPKAEAGNIIRTGMYMPVKVNFDGDVISGHAGAIPIGPIVDLHEEGETIVGRAVVWPDEFSEFAAYLDRTTAEAVENIQFSWEIYHQDSYKDSSGINWLTGCSVAGAAIVDNPAYKGRTPLLAIAEENKMNELETKISNLMDKLYTMLNALYEAADVAAEFKATNPGELSVDDDFSFIIDKVKEMRGSMAASAEHAEMLKAEVEELRDFKTKAEAEDSRAAVLNARRASLAEVGVTFSDGDFIDMSAFIVEMSDTVFTSYVSSAAKIAKSAKATAENARKSTAALVPDPTHQDDFRISLSDLAEGLRAFNRAG